LFVESDKAIGHGSIVPDLAGRVKYIIAFNYNESINLVTLATQTTITSQREALAAGISAILWVAILVSLHIIKPSLKPAVHTLSEYAIKPNGWIMQAAFFLIAISCYALTLALWPYASQIGLVLLAVAGVGFTGAGAFVTDPLTRGEESVTTRGTLHIIFSLLAIPLLPIAATALSINMANDVLWPLARVWLPTLSILAWVGLVGFLGGPAICTLLLHKRAPIGYLQRFMVLTYTIWLIGVAIIVGKL
jgi:hypothetical protein